jgi:hypothetical protein
MTMSDLRKAREEQAMTLDDILRMARQAGWHGMYNKPLMSISLKEDQLVHFAALVAAAEREACKAIADQYAWSQEAKFIAAKIQERGAT